MSQASAAEQPLPGRFSSLTNWVADWGAVVINAFVAVGDFAQFAPRHLPGCSRACRGEKHCCPISLKWEC